MTNYRLMDGANGRPGNGPSAAVSYSGDFLAGTVFEVTADNVWFEGYWWWVCDSGQQTDPQSFALWQVDTTNNGILVDGGTVTSGALTSGTWNYIALPTPIQLSRSIPYVVATGYVSASGFPNTNNEFGADDTYSAGIVNGPLTGYSDTSGSMPVPGNWTAQGLFATTYSDPTAHIPDDNFESGNFWIDLQVSTTAPSGVSYRLWPSLPNPPGRITDSAANFTLGTESSLSENCALGRIWFYSPQEASQLPTECGIWNISSQSLVAGSDNSSPAWSDPAGSGWVSCEYTSTRWLSSMAPRTLAPGTRQPSITGIRVLAAAGSPAALSPRRTRQAPPVPGRAPITLEVRSPTPQPTTPAGRQPTGSTLRSCRPRRRRR
jgi:hypothetical protein